MCMCIYTCGMVRAGVCLMWRGRGRRGRREIGRGGGRVVQFQCHILQLHTIKNVLQKCPLPATPNSYYHI